MWQAKANALEDSKQARAASAARRALMSPDPDASNAIEQEDDMDSATARVGAGAGDGAGPAHVVTGVRRGGGGGDRRRTDASAQAGDGPDWLERRMQVIDVKFFERPATEGREDDHGMR